MKPSLIIFLSVLAAAVVVAFGFVIINRYQSQYRTRETLPAYDSTEVQAEYMRQVRVRNRHKLAEMAGYPRGF